MPSATFLTKVSCFWVNGLCCFAMTVEITTIRRRRPRKDPRFAHGDPLNRGCLIHMPTGTGKTGVMAVLATMRSASAPVLVVCASAALVEQLMSEFRSRFWDTISAGPEWRPNRILQALPGSVRQLGDELRASGGQRTIVVATIQAVQQIHARPPAVGPVVAYLNRATCECERQRHEYDCSEACPDRDQGAHRGNLPRKRGLEGRGRAKHYSPDR